MSKLRDLGDQTYRQTDIPGLPIWLIFPQQADKKTGHNGDVLHAENDEVHLFFGVFKFTTKYNANSGLPIYNYVNGIYKFKAYNTDIDQDVRKADNLTLAQRSLLKWHI